MTPFANNASKCVLFNCLYSLVMWISSNIENMPTKVFALGLNSINQLNNQIGLVFSKKSAMNSLKFKDRFLE